MEEDIKILIEENPTWKKEKAIKNLRNLIKKYKQLEEENKKMEELIENAECDMATNFIRKSKVKEKIGEYEKVIDETNDGDLIKDLMQRISILQELLREE